MSIFNHMFLMKKRTLNLKTKLCFIAFLMIAMNIICKNILSVEMNRIRLNLICGKKKCKMGLQFALVQILGSHKSALFAPYF